MKKRTLYQSLSVFAIAAIFSASLTYGGSVKSFFQPKIARASLTVTCDCALFGGNTNCLANNYGASCSSSEDCQGSNANCGGKKST